MNTPRAVLLFPESPDYTSAIEDLHLSALTLNNCKQIGIKTLGQLIDRMINYDSDFLMTFGERSRQELQKQLTRRGIHTETIHPITLIALSKPIFAN